MGLFDSVIGAIGQGGGQGGGRGELLNAVVGMLANNAPGGGLGGLVNQFQRGGMGNIVASWISTGQNLPVSADQVQQALGPETIGRLAQQLGLSQGDVAGQLSQMLPQVVDKLTPNGQLPSGGLGDVGSLLGSLMGR
jgi:uncharacterized protein YidB (DUF937 family)